ncbi:MAG TPA: hypothetical protein VGP68_03115 [Gemmataceae bacterium]|nr:hypothetical protein [Gemmataceae bacterium]
MFAIAQLAMLFSFFALCACIVWLHWRAFRDGQFQDALLFVTGISTLSYISSRWDRAKVPVFGAIAAFLTIVFLAIFLARVDIGASQDSSIPGLATELENAGRLAGSGDNRATLPALGQVLVRDSDP